MTDIDRAVAAYLGNYEIRRTRSPSRLVFDVPAQDAVVGLLLDAIVAKLPPHRARAVAEAELLALSRNLPSAGPDPALNLGLYAYLKARITLGYETPSDDEFRARLSAGAEPPAVAGAVGIAARHLVLTLVARSPMIEAPEGIHEDARLSAGLAARRLATMADAFADADRAQVGTVARVAWLAASAAVHQPEEQLGEAVARLLDGIAGAGAFAAWPSAHLAQVMLAADRAERRELSQTMLELLRPRIDAETFLVRSTDEEQAPYEFSPWVPLALTQHAQDMGPIERVLDPPAAPLPDFHVRDVRGTSEGLVYELVHEGVTHRRSLDGLDLNLLVDRALKMSEAATSEAQSGRIHGHKVISLLELADVCAGETRDDVERLIERSLTRVLETQEPNGGWSYANVAKPSHVYSPGGLKSTDFPVRQYTIDAAVPGIALALAFERTGDPNYLAALERIVDFFEQSIGRVQHEGREIWRLFPEDAKTATQGTAVNYELWNGYFFAAVARAAPSHPSAARLRRYAQDAVAYAGGHLDPSGDIAYGDYVQEMRTAYAAWDAYLLAEIHRALEIPEASEMARLIVARLDGLLLDSGAMPNVSQYYEDIGGVRRWLVHRHGIGPFPIRADYQLYHVVAAGAAGAEPAAALRALVFTINAFHDPVFGSLGAGFYGGEGEFDDRAGVFARDWIIHALALLPRMSGMTFTPDRSRIRPAADRLHRLIERTYHAAAADHVDQAGAVALARGCAACFRATRDDAWLERGRGLDLSPAFAAAVHAGALLERASGGSQQPPGGQLPAAVVDRHRGEAHEDGPVRVALEETASLMALRALSDGSDAWARRARAHVTEVLARTQRRAVDLDELLPVTLWLLEALAADPADQVGSGDGVVAFLDDLWSRHFEPSGRGRDDDGAAMHAVTMVRAALAFVRAGALFARPAFDDRGMRILRFLLHAYRLPTGLLGARPGESASGDTHSAMFDGLARVLAERGDLVHQIDG